MLFRKMLRDYRAHFGAFFSVFLLAALSMAMFVTFEGHVLSQYVARDAFHETCRLSDVWVYGEQFSEEQLDAVRALDFVDSAQLRTMLGATAPDFDGAQVDLYLTEENLINMPYTIEGADFDPTDTDGLWLTNAFAERRGIHVGDEFTMDYNGMHLTREVKGLVESAEYEFRQADNDADVYLENIAFVFMAPDDALKQAIPYTQMVIRTADAGALSHETAIADALDNDYSAMIDRDSVPGLARLDSELSQHQSFSYVFAIIFLGIAVLIIATTMSRIIDRQRTQIGTMNALGLARRKILWHYLSFSLFVSALGAAAGCAVGFLWGSPLMIQEFSSFYIVPGLHNTFHPVYMAIAAAIVAVCVLTSYLSCRRLLHIKPAESLRPAAPKQGKSCLFERLPFWERLSFSAQYNLRDISRAKLRTFMCIVGTSVGMLLMIYAVGCTHLVNSMISVMFDQVTVGDYQVKLENNAALSDADALSEKLDGELVMTSAIEVAKTKNAPSDEKKKETVTVLEGKDLYCLLDPNGEKISLTEGTIGVSRKLAADLDIAVGDTVYWHLYEKNTWYSAEVGVIYRSNESQGIAYLRTDYEKTGAAYVPTLLLTDTDQGDAADLDFVAAVNSKQELKDIYEKNMESVDLLVWMMGIFSVLMLLVVLYNSGSLSFNERVKEFATLKVLGLRSSQIRRLLSLQNLWLSIIGILIGIPLGNSSLNAMMNSNGENFDYNLSLNLSDYVLSGVFVVLVSMLVGYLFQKRIRRLDMVETLKGLE